jgi:molecular chaperone DnaK
MAVIGIDLGTTYSAAARCVNGVPEIINLEGRSTMPSVVGLQKNGKIAIGLTAKRNQARFPTNTIIEVKRKMGGTEDIHLGDRTFKAPEISAMILDQIKKLAESDLGEPVTGAVISCPAYFMDPARAATKQAAEIAGLKVLSIINEPTAAAYAYGVREGSDEKEKLFVIYDLGGGTFDVTVIKMISGQLEVIGTGGDPQLGGGNFDDKIVDWIIAGVQAKYPEYANR